jgi:putative transposase
MSQSLSNIILHVIFSTKSRHPWIKNELRPTTHAYIAGVVRECGCEAYRVGGVDDHIHIALRLSRTISVSNLVREVKSSSSKWLKTQAPNLGKFSWQQGYGAFSVGMSQKDALVSYIDNQEEHHRAHTFQDEYRNFLQKYGIVYDERYVWD